ncbi:Oidioi.mRNA.OKI2018_I69.chr2.g4406.t1.cds [Oikopleura dioica]|uniref:Oidioi.mRNA.OKI2018_I69.chr2.g4406.t1.cds n=1 Tax=Oikopleura dioica TaxID=34765 RepID=A0ABN7SWU6_OIKDI|nr:Oidioi.mRNA.OKI2018_I69.chr2.g4406.t1.cds [Oikopleura dioica]
MEETFLRELFFRKKWVLIIFSFALTILMMTKPGLNLISKTRSALSPELMMQLPAGSIDEFDRQFFGQINVKPSKQHKPKTITEKDISNITVMNLKGQVFKGIKVDDWSMVTYDEAKQFCEERGAVLPWFELAKSNLLPTRQFWIESECNYFDETIQASNEISKASLDNLMKKFVQEYQTLILIEKNSEAGLSACLWPNQQSLIDNFQKQYLCKNTTDELGRAVLYQSQEILCDLQKMNITHIQDYHILDRNFKGETWVSKVIGPGAYARLVSGWKLSDDLTDSGLKLCSYAAQCRLVQRERLEIFRQRNACTLCIYKN